MNLEGVPMLTKLILSTTEERRKILKEADSGTTRQLLVELLELVVEQHKYMNELLEEKLELVNQLKEKAAVE